ncbi:MAG: hypothetical protein WC740_12855 [Verrucomicrobiia bacterium]
MKPIVCVTLVVLLLAPLASLHAADLQVRVAPMVTACKRQGITGSGWASVCDVAHGAKTAGRIALIFRAIPMTGENPAAPA